MKNVVSFSLWGTSDVYHQAAEEMVGQVARAYPGWEPWFYLGKDVPASTRERLADQGARILEGPSWGPWAGMYWRFLAAADPEVGIMISRDVDTEILEREVAAVHEWLESGKTLHIMRDHPKHEMPVMGGMWGCRTAKLRDIQTLILKHGRFGRYGDDQRFLSTIIYPKFLQDSCIHSECITFPRETIHPFPLLRQHEEVIGIAARDANLIELQIRYLREWKGAGCPILRRPHPWSLAGRLRVLTKGRWPGESLTR